MARLLTCGFEMGTYDEMNGPKGVINPDISTVYKRTGDYGLVLTRSACYIGHAFEANVSDLYFRTAVQFTGLGIGVDANFLALQDDLGDELITLFFNSGTQTLDIKRGGVTLTAGGFAISADRWYVMEGHVVINASGSVTVKLNGITHVSYTGDTDTGNSGVRSILYTGSSTATQADYIAIDDIAYNDTQGSYQNSWIGLGGIYLLKPNGEGFTQDFTPSAGTVHYTLVDDVPANITDWVQADTGGQVELFDLDDTPTYITTVDLVEVVGQAAVVESGSNTVQGIMRQGTVDYSGTVTTTVVSVADSYVVIKSEPFYVQPSTSTAWGTADVNDLQAGWEIP